MKKVLFIFWAVLASVHSCAQGTIAFQNISTPALVYFENFTFNAPIFGPDGQGLGPEARVQLFLLDETPVGEPQGFEPGSPGFFFAGAIEVPGGSPGSQQTFLVRAWIGDSYEAAAVRGQVTSWSTHIAGDMPPISVHFQSFTIIPEASILAAAALGAFLLYGTRCGRLEDSRRRRAEAGEPNGAARVLS